jgi:NitT/TauT family transport system substrate-binding protein
VLSLAACSGDKSGNGQSKSDVKTIRIGWVYSMANAPVLIAKEKDYFKALGINVKLYQFSSGPKIYQKLLTGELDMAYIGAAPVFHWHNQGLKTKILAKVNYGQASVLVREDSGISNVTELKGKKIAGVRIGSGMDVLLRGYVIREAAGLDPLTDVEIIAMKPGNMGAAVENKIVDAAFCWEPFASQYWLKGNVKIIMDVNKDIPKYPWYVIIATEKAVNEKQKLIVDILKAHKHAVDFLNSSEKAGNEIIARSFYLQSVKNKTGEVYTPAAIVTEARKRVGWSYNISDSDKMFLKRLVRYSRDLKYLRQDVDVEKIIETKFMDQVLAQ